MICGEPTPVERTKGAPGVQFRGPGFRKILLGDDIGDRGEKCPEVMFEGGSANGGGGCITCPGMGGSRHTREIARALAERLGPVTHRPPEDPESSLAAFTVPGAARAIWAEIESRLGEPGAEDMTARFGPRLAEKERCAYLRPTVIHCDSPELELANTEYMFPFVSVVRCPQEKMLQKIGSTLVCSAITRDKEWQRKLIDAPQIDRLNIGAIPTIKLDWLQPHEGNIVEFLFRPRAFQAALEAVAV